MKLETEKCSKLMNFHFTIKYMKYLKQAIHFLTVTYNIGRSTDFEYIFRALNTSKGNSEKQFTPYDNYRVIPNPKCEYPYSLVKSIFTKCWCQFINLMSRNVTLLF